MEKEERLSELLKEAESHPMMKAILTEKAAAVLGERLLAAAKLRAATEEAEKVIPERQQEVDALVAELTEYDKGRSVILDRLTAARVELAKERQRLDRERSHAEEVLLSNYDPRIDETVAFFRDRIYALMAKKAASQTHKTGTNPFTEKKQLTIYSNADAIRDALMYCRDAIKELEETKLKPDLDVERIEALKKGIPDADELREYVGDKLLEKGPDPGFLGKMWAEGEARVDRLLGR